MVRRAGRAGRDVFFTAAPSRKCSSSTTLDLPVPLRLSVWVEPGVASATRRFIPGRKSTARKRGSLAVSRRNITPPPGQQVVTELDDAERVEHI